MIILFQSIVVYKVRSLITLNPIYSNWRYNPDKFIYHFSENKISQSEKLLLPKHLVCYPPYPHPLAYQFEYTNFTLHSELLLHH